MRRVPYVPQLEAVECGAACLTMMLRVHGHHAELPEVREACGVSRDGVSALSIVRVAREYGLVPTARRLEPHELIGVGPAIIHWEMNHFVVLEDCTATGARLVDPSVGPRRITREQLDRGFTGICIELVPGEGFKKRRPRRDVMGRVVSLLRGSRSQLAVVFGASLLLNLVGLAVPLFTRLTVDQVIGAGQHAWLTILGPALLALTGYLFLLSVLRGRILIALRRSLDEAISVQLVRHLLSLPVRFFQQRHSGDLLERVQSTKTLREILAGQAIALVVDGALLISFLTLMLALSFELGLVVGTAGVLYGVLFLALRPGQQERFRERVVQDVKQEVQLLQTVQGIVTLKASGREWGAHHRWLKRLVSALNAGWREAHLQDLAGALLFAVRALVPALVLVLGIAAVLDHRITLGTLLGFQMLQFAFLGPLARTIQTLLRLTQLPVLLSRLDDVLSTTPEPSGQRPCPLLKGEVQFEGVSFRYGPTTPDVLDQLSFTVRPGEKVALVGSSGSGKSTVARLLLGLFRPTAGRILLDGQPLDELELASVRRQLGVVLQETALFDGTVRENISLYHPTATLEEVVQAARVAQLHDDLQALPLGYDTPLSASATALSGGQRQRLALARAVLHRPQILVLDEATSALDSVTEAAVENYLSTRACSRLVIAHRLSTVVNADRILVLEAGRVVEQGRHRELLALDGVYARLFHSAQPTAVTPEQKDHAPSLPPSALSQFAPFAALTDEDRLGLIGRFQRRIVPEGTALLTQGEPGAGLFLLEEGTVEARVFEPGLPPWKIGERTQGAVLGEVGLLDSEPSSATVTTLTRCQVLHLPLRDFEQTRDERNGLSLRLVLALGSLVCARLREATEQRRSVGNSGTGVEARADLSTDEGSARGTLGLEETPLGASLTSAEAARFLELGTVLTLQGGQVLFRENDLADTCYLVLGGRVGMQLGGLSGHLNVLEPGDLLGEVGFFDGGVRTSGCTAIGPAVIFAFRHELVRELLEAGHAFAWKVLRHLIHSVVGTLRVSTLRLREAIATERGEHEMAFRARDQALAAARAQELAVINAEATSGRVPLVLATNPSGTAAASLTAVLRHLGRPVPLAVVSEAISEGGSVNDRSLEQGARSFGIALRRLVLTIEDTRGMDQPLLLDLGGRFAVAEGWAQGRMLVMDPSEGQLALTPRELGQRWNQQCFEVRGEQHRRQTLRERLTQWVGVRRAALLQLVGITALLQVAALGVPLATGALIGVVLQQRVSGLVPVIGLGLIALVLGQTALTWLRARVLAFLRARLDLDLLDQLMAHVLRLPLEHFERHTASSLLQRFESFRVLRALLSSDGIAAVLDLTMTSLSMVMLSLVNVRLAGVVLVAVLVQALLLRFFVPRLARFTAVQLEASAQQKHGLLEVLAGLVTLRLSGDPDNGARRWLPRLNRELNASAQLEGLSWWLQATGDLTQKLALTLLLWVGAAEVVAGHLTLAAMMVFLGVAASFFGAMGVVSAEVLNLARSAPRLRQLGQTFDERPEQSIETTVQPGRLKGRISLDGVSFRYAPDAPLVLRDLQLTIEPGTKVALVGASGSGKSTLGKLLVGFYLPTAGQISFDRRDLASLELPALRSQLGVVLQDTFLFTGSIRENLSLCAPSAELSRLEDAAREASLDHVIDALPMRYDTVVSEGGSAFSGGQRQRLALARALVHSPAVLLLDEATSALDNVTQAAVEQNLARLSCTRVVIAHRLSTVIDADQIVVLEKGQIIETGRHHELLAKQGAYYRLINAQLGGEQSGQPRP